MIEFHARRDPIFEPSESGHVMYAEWFTRNIDNDLYLPLVAIVGGIAVGFCMSIIREKPGTWLYEEYGEINDLGVSSQFRRKGVGEKLVKTSIEWFNSRGITRIEAKIAPPNEISSRFWRKIGLKPYLETLYLNT